MPDGLYERDILAWSEEQARLLQRLASGEAGVNAVVDWPNLIEEVEALGRSELNACRGLLLQALVHLQKLHAWPGSAAAGHWQDEAAAFLAQAQLRYLPSMQQRIELQVLWRRALSQVHRRSDDSGEPRPVPAQCPLTPDDLLADDPDVTALAAKLGGANAWPV